jgi:hypothetical protein
MIALLVAAAMLQPQPPWVERSEDIIGRPYHPAPSEPPVLFVVRIESPTGNPRTEFRVRRWGRSGEGNTYYYIAREINDDQDHSEHLVNSRDCPPFLRLLRELASLHFAPLHVEGISPESPAPESSGWSYLFGGPALHATGQGGEMVVHTYQVAGAEPDPLARWARAFETAYATCLSAGG